jgi:SSS family transporter
MDKLSAGPPSALAISWLDYLVIFAYLAAMVTIGLVHARRARGKDLNDYFLAGREFRWIVVGTSLMAALNSGIDYLMQPSGMIRFGVYTLVGNFSWLLLYPYVFFITLPLYRKLKVVSAYEYLEQRFDSRVRTLTAGIFMLWRLGWMATALYVPSLAFAVATGRPESTSLFIILIGIVVTGYTAMGGIRAVVWTDITQFCIMFTGLTVTIVIILNKVDGGFVAIMADWREIGAEALTQLSPEAAQGGFVARTTGFFMIPMTITGVFVATMVSRLTAYTSDQVMVQRFQTARSIGDARKGFVITACSDVVWMLALSFIGMALYTYYKVQYGSMPDWTVSAPDQVFPFFMTQVFPAGLTGLVIAAIMAASLSSIDSALNAMTSVAVIDFFNRFRTHNDEGGDPSEVNRRQVRVSRLLTLVIGAVGIAVACNVSKLGSLIEIATKLINSFTGPILGIFLLGMFSRRTGSTSVLIGGACGVSVTVFVAYQAQIYQFLGLPAGEVISFLWPTVFGFLTTVGVAFALSLVFKPRCPEKAEHFTWRAVTKK